MQMRQKFSRKRMWEAEKAKSMKGNAQQVEIDS